MFSGPVGAVQLQAVEAAEQDPGGDVQLQGAEAAGKIFCWCKGPEEGEMIHCDSEACKVGWFHFPCEGILFLPTGQWLCPDCQSKFYFFTNVKVQTTV